MIDVSHEQDPVIETRASHLRQGMFAALSGLLLLLATQLWLNRVERAPRLQIDAGRLRVTAPQNDLVRLGKDSLKGIEILSGGDVSLFDQSLRDRIEADLLRHPLVRGLRSFDRKFGEGLPRVDIGLTLRNPYAAVVIGEKQLLVDRDGLYLCWVISAAQSRGLPRIEIDLPGSPPPKPLGRATDIGPAREIGEATLAALDLLKHFELPEVRRHAVFQWAHFRRVRVTAPRNFGVSGDPHLELELVGGHMVSFGHPPSAIYGGGLQGLLVQLDRLQRAKDSHPTLARIAPIDVSISDPLITEKVP